MVGDRRDIMIERLNGVIDSALARGLIMGTVILVLQDGNICYQRAAGYADHAAGRLMAPNSIFRLASLTKPIISVALMRLVEQGKASLSDPIHRYLPDFRPALGDGSQPNITLHHLLTHTAGLDYGFRQPANGSYLHAGISDGLDRPGRSFDENLRLIATIPLNFKPGTAWGYSVAIDVLGAALENICGKSLGEVVYNLVTEPLGMADTSFALTDQSQLTVAYKDGDTDRHSRPLPIAEHDIVPYAGLAGLHMSPNRFANPSSFPSGGCGMLGTAPDFAKFLETVRTGGAPLLTKATTAQMTRNQIGELRVVTREPGWGFGYGWAVLLDPARAATPHQAGTLQWGGVYGHSWFVDPIEKLTLVGLTNTAVAGMTGAFPTAIRNAVYGIS